MVKSFTDSDEFFANKKKTTKIQMRITLDLLHFHLLEVHCEPTGRIERSLMSNL